MAGTVAFVGGASGDRAIVNVSTANPLPVTAVTATIGVVTIADGADVAEGTTTDAAVTNPALAATEIALLKGLLTYVNKLTYTAASALIIDDATHSFINITTATTTVVKNSPGSLHQVIINSKSTGAGTATIYDNTVASGTKVATLDVGTNVAVTINYDVTCAIGITIVTSAACDLTVTYR